MNNESLIGTYRKIPANTTFWSIALQENVKVEKELIMKITHIVPPGNGVFGILIDILFNMPGYIPTPLERHNGELSILLQKTEPYAIPLPTFLEYKYNDKPLI